MSIGLVGRKCGMTTIYNDDGTAVPVSVVEVLPNRVTQLKTPENDGYIGVQLTTGEVKQSRVNKTIAGHYKKANVPAGRGLWEFNLEDQEISFQVGDEIKVDIFEAGQKVDVRGTSKGKGFAGVVKRWNFRTQDASHGNSLSHRAPGSIGQNQTPGRVFKGKKMAGQLGNERVTVQSLELVRVDLDHNLLLIKGAIPGAPGGDVVVSHSVKSPKKDKAK